MLALRAALSAVLERSAVSIPLAQKKFGISVATVPDAALFDDAVFVLAARADVPADELRTRFPLHMKLGPVEKIRDLVNLQLAGHRPAAHGSGAAPDSVPRRIGLLRDRSRRGTVAPAADQRGDRRASVGRVRGIGARALGDTQLRCPHEPHT